MEISWNGSSFYYSKSGSGHRVIVLLHGYGQDHSHFTPITEALGNEFTCYSFDLFFHGKSKWAHGERPISTDEAQSFFLKFLEQEGIQRFSIIGYSIGCRFALACLASRARSVDDLVLVAPDGFSQNFWYAVATSSAVMRTFFRYTIEHPRFFSKLTDLARSLRLVHPKALTFSERMMSDPQKREKVYYTWVVFRRLRLTSGELRDFLSKYEIRCTVILGKEDKIIEPGKMKKTLSRFEKIQIRHVEGGHHRMLVNLPVLIEEIFTTRNDIQR
jgi:pimeloyl-ACP methyl ester carboxylesterase